MTFSESVDEGQVSRFKIPGNKTLTGIGYVMIPLDIDRDEYIKNCLFSNSISICTENSERFDNVQMNKGLWNEISFPKKPSEIGSIVFWVRIENSNQPIIVSILNKKNELTVKGEEEFYIGRDNNNADIFISGSTKDGILLVEVDSKVDDLGEIIIKARNSTKNSKITIISDGSVNVVSKDLILNVRNELQITIPSTKADKKTYIHYSEENGFYYKDIEGNEVNINSDGVKVLTNKFQIGEGSEVERIAKGESLKALLKELIHEVSNITTTTMLGVMPVNNKTKITALLGKLEPIVSQTTYSN
jgi:hypothetical protein